MRSLFCLVRYYGKVFRMARDDDHTKQGAADRDGALTGQRAARCSGQAEQRKGNDAADARWVDLDQRRKQDIKPREDQNDPRDRQQRQHLAKGGRNALAAVVMVQRRDRMAKHRRDDDSREVHTVDIYGAIRKIDRQEAF